MAIYPLRLSKISKQSICEQRQLYIFISCIYSFKFIFLALLLLIVSLGECWTTAETLAMYLEHRRSALGFSSLAIIALGFCRSLLSCKEIPNQVFYITVLIIALTKLKKNTQKCLSLILEIWRIYIDLLSNFTFIGFLS